MVAGGMTTGTAFDVAPCASVEEIAAELPSPLVPLVEVAAAIGVDPSTVRRTIYDGSRGVEAREREDGSGNEVNVATLSSKYRAAFADQIAPGPSVARALALGDSAPRYRAASEAVRERARFRYAAVLTFVQARKTRQANKRLAGGGFGTSAARIPASECAFAEQSRDLARRHVFAHADLMPPHCSRNFPDISSIHLQRCTVRRVRVLPSSSEGGCSPGARRLRRLEQLQME